MFLKKKKNCENSKFKIRLSQIFKMLLLSRNNDSSVHQATGNYLQLGDLLWKRGRAWGKGTPFLQESTHVKQATLVKVADRPQSCYGAIALLLDDHTPRKTFHLILLPILNSPQWETYLKKTFLKIIKNKFLCPLAHDPRQ